MTIFEMITFKKTKSWETKTLANLTYENKNSFATTKIYTNYTDINETKQKLFNFQK